MEITLKDARVFLYRTYKFEARNTKYERISNDQNPNDRNFVVEHSFPACNTWTSFFCHLNISALNLFRPALARYDGYWTLLLSYNQSERFGTKFLDIRSGPGISTCPPIAFLPEIPGNAYLTIAGKMRKTMRIGQWQAGIRISDLKIWCYCSRYRHRNMTSPT